MGPHAAAKPGTTEVKGAGSLSLPSRRGKFSPKENPGWHSRPWSLASCPSTCPPSHPVPPSLATDQWALHLQSCVPRLLEHLSSICSLWRTPPHPLRPNSNGPFSLRVSPIPRAPSLFGALVAPASPVNWSVETPVISPLSSPSGRNSPRRGSRLSCTGWSRADLRSPSQLTCRSPE